MRAIRGRKPQREAIQEIGVAVIGCFIVGCDGETRQSLDLLAEFIEAGPLADVQLTVQTPFPGTALHRRLQREGRLIPERGWEFYTLFDVTSRPDLLTVEELEVGFRRLVRRLFSTEDASRCHPAARLAAQPEAAKRHSMGPFTSSRSADTIATVLGQGRRLARLST